MEQLSVCIDPIGTHNIGDHYVKRSSNSGKNSRRRSNLNDVIGSRDVIGNVTICLDALGHCPIGSYFPIGNNPLSPLVSEIFSLKDADIQTVRQPRRLTIRNTESLQHAGISAEKQ